MNAIISSSDSYLRWIQSSILSYRQCCSRYWSNIQVIHQSRKNRGRTHSNCRRPAQNFAWYYTCSRGSYNKHGCSCRIRNVLGFLPPSQICWIKCLGSREIVEDSWLYDLFLVRCLVNWWNHHGCNIHFKPSAILGNFDWTVDGYHVLFDILVWRGTIRK